MLAGMADAIDYTTPGPLTGLGNVSPLALESVPDDAVGICWPVHSMVIQPDRAQALGAPAERFAENQVRCGFATYFQRGQGLDHWITEYWHNGDGRWVRIDSEILGQSILPHPEDLQAGQFLTGGEAWAALGRVGADNRVMQR